MVLNVGIISACIVYKNRAGAKTRLERLSAKLKQKPISKKILYSYPVKNIFSIALIICFIGGLLLFLQEYKNQIMQKHLKDSFPQERLKSFGQDLSKIKLFQEHQSPKNIKITYSGIEFERQYKKVETTVYTIILFFILAIIILIKTTRFQRLIIKGKPIGVNDQKIGQIDTQQLSIFGWSKYETIICQKSNKFIIQLCGDDRFTNKSTYYAVKRLQHLDSYQKDNHEKQNAKQKLDSKSKYKQTTIIKRGNIFQARQTMIYLCNIMKQQANLNIKNGPIKQSKFKF